MKLKLFFWLALVLIVPAQHTQAHELLPAVIVNYMAEHPNATPEEIKAFAATQDPVVTQAIAKKSSKDLIDIVKNQDSSYLDTGLDFIQLGIKHILSGPDHILFVLSLLLVFVSVRNLLKLVTSFTVAHSLTLILAGTGVLVLSSTVVEPFIALSIAIMAIASVFFKDHPLMSKHSGKLGLVFFFGLFHGLGFAGLLKEIAVPENKFALSLLSFNIGIEFGQLIIVALVVPFIFCFRHKAWFDTVIRVTAVLIAVAGFTWFFERLTVLF